MIINIPLNIPDEMLENTIAKDYENKITERLTAEFRKAMCDHDAFDDILKEYCNNDVIATEAAADKLAERLARTKAAKELIK